MVQKKVLIIEDEAIVAKDIEYTLGELGYEARSITGHFQTVLKKVDRFRPDLILMDIVLKGKINGISLARSIQKKFGIPIVYLTAYGDVEIVEKAKLTGPFGYILKPFEKNDLRIAIEIALYKHSVEKKLHQVLKELKKERKRAQQLAEKVIELQEKERLYLASVIHDEFLQILVVYLYFLQRIKKIKLPDKLEAERKKLIQNIRDGIKRARSLINEIHPIQEPELGLLTMIRQSAEMRFAGSDVRVKVIGPKSIPRLSPMVKTNLLRIAQEALMNIYKYARARNVVISITLSRTNMLLVIEDDGVGFDRKRLKSPKKNHFGLLIMEQRARFIRAKLKIISKPGKGTRIECRLPLS